MTDQLDGLAPAEYDQVVRAGRGDRDAFTELFDRYDRKLFYFVGRFGRDPHRASDIVQDVWLSAYRRLPGLRAPEAFRAWLYRLTHDRVVSRIRKETRKRPIPLERSPCLSGRSDQASRDAAEVVHAALGRLSAEHRAVLTLRFLEGMSLEEIAAVVDRPLGTVKSRMHHAKSAFEAVTREIADGDPLR